MSVIATALKHLIAAGVTGDDLVRAVAEMEAEQAAVAIKARTPGALRTERWRARKAAETSQTASQNVTCDASDACDVAPSLSRPPNENNSNPPTHTHPDGYIPRARKADPFPKPDWADAQHWRDLLANRKAKNLPNTATAHAKFLRDIDRLADDEWPPGRLLEAIVARGWASAYDPRETRNDRKPACNDEIQNPYAAVVAARQAARAGDERGQPGGWP